jgi:uncharacterized membrane protein
MRAADTIAACLKFGMRMVDRIDGQGAERDLSSSAKGNLELLAIFNAREEAEISGMRLQIERVSAFFGSPAYFLFAVVFVGGWVLVNAWGTHAGWAHVDPPPYSWLQGIVSSNALLLTVAVLIRQNRMAQVAEHRSHLDLQINLLTEQKVTKILQIVDGLRREPQRPSTALDEEVSDLAIPADAQALLHAIKGKNEQR